MGTRANIYIGDKNCVTAAILYCNSSHPEVDPLILVRLLASKAIGLSSFTRACLDARYPSDGGNHKEGQHVFSLDSEPDNHELIIGVSTSDQDEYLQVEEIEMPKYINANDMLTEAVFLFDETTESENPEYLRGMSELIGYCFPLENAEPSESAELAKTYILERCLASRKSLL